MVLMQQCCIALVIIIVWDNGTEHLHISAAPRVGKVHLVTMTTKKEYHSITICNVFVVNEMTVEGGDDCITCCFLIPQYEYPPGRNTGGGEEKFMDVFSIIDASAEVWEHWVRILINCDNETKYVCGPCDRSCRRLGIIAFSVEQGHKKGKQGYMVASRAHRISMALSSFIFSIMAGLRTLTKAAPSV